jgi:uncharacterized protein (DUF2141 family)
VRNGAGDIRFALFDNPAEFPEGERFAGQEVAAVPGEVGAIFRDVPPGTYAVAIHHDENRNNRMDLVFNLLPQEGYGFSNNARVVLTAPTFAAAAFDVPEEDASIRLRVVY